MKYIIWNKTTEEYWNDTTHEWTYRQNATQFSLEQLGQMAFRSWGEDHDIFGLVLINGMRG